MRLGEVCGLRWVDVDLDGARLSVRRQRTVVNGHVIELEHPKSDHGRRVIDLDAVTVAILRGHRRRQQERRLAFGAGWEHHDLVFCGADGAPVNPEYVSKAFLRRARGAGVAPIRFHDLRHTHAAHMLAAGRNPLEVSRRLGHGSVSFTLDRYGHLMPEAGAHVAAAVAALVDGKQRDRSMGLSR
jgi:integrase